MNNTAIRLAVVVALVAVLFLGTLWLQAGLKPPNVKFPDWTLEQMPFQLGAWRGKSDTLDPKTFEISGADFAVNRTYSDDAGRVISLMVALFGDPDKGVYHSPMNCYRSQGWQKGAEDTLPIHVADQKKIDGDFTTWERGGERVIVLYWYQIGEHVFFDRFKLGEVRWAMRGRETWPVTIKVLMQTPASIDPEQDKARLRDLAANVYRWLNEIAPQSDSDSAGN